MTLLPFVKLTALSLPVSSRFLSHTHTKLMVSLRPMAKTCYIPMFEKAHWCLSGLGSNAGLGAAPLRGAGSTQHCCSPGRRHGDAVMPTVCVLTWFSPLSLGALQSVP